MLEAGANDPYWPTCAMSLPGSSTKESPLRSQRCIALPGTIIHPGHEREDDNRTVCWRHGARGLSQGDGVIHFAHPEALLARLRTLAYLTDPEHNAGQSACGDLRCWDLQRSEHEKR